MSPEHGWPDRKPTSVGAAPRPFRGPPRSGEQFCAHCDYDITGLDLTGRLIRCPECGKENRIGHLDLDSAHCAMPAWWSLALLLGWPAVPWAVVTYFAALNGPGPFLTGMIVLGGLVLFAAMSRATMIAFDCSRPGRRSAALSWTMLWAVAGSIGLVALGFAAVFSLWAIGMFLDSIRPT